MVAGLECFDASLMPHLGILLLGIAMMTPLGEALALPALRSKWKSLETLLGRTFAGLFLIMFSGFTVSAHTLWMHNKAQEMGGGSFCSAGAVCDCASVIGNSDWNTMPFIGLPWGLLGMLAFALFMWLIISIAKDPAASWVLTHLKIGTNFGILGIGIILYLMYAEYEIGKICQFCTTAHIAHVVATIGFFRLSSLYGSSEWAVANSGISGMDSSSRERRKRGGYVAPKISKDLEKSDENTSSNKANRKDKSKTSKESKQSTVINNITYNISDSAISGDIKSEIVGNVELNESSQEEE